MADPKAPDVVVTTPTVRERVCDAFKAFYVAVGREPIRLRLNIKAYCDLLPDMIGAMPQAPPQRIMGVAVLLQADTAKPDIQLE